MTGERLHSCPPFHVKVIGHTPSTLSQEPHVATSHSLRDGDSLPPCSLCLTCSSMAQSHCSRPTALQAGTQEVVGQLVHLVTLQSLTQHKVIQEYCLYKAVTDYQETSSMAPLHKGSLNTDLKCQAQKYFWKICIYMRHLSCITQIHFLLLLHLFFETRSCFIVQAGLEPLIFLPQSPECWDQSIELPQPTC